MNRILIELWIRRCVDHRMCNAWMNLLHVLHKYRNFCLLWHTILIRVFDQVIFWWFLQFYYIFVFRINWLDRQFARWLHLIYWWLYINFQVVYRTFWLILLYNHFLGLLINYFIKFNYYYTHWLDIDYLHLHIPYVLVIEPFIMPFLGVYWLLSWSDY